MISAPAPVVYVHIGTHKTGSTSIQAFFSANEPLFARAGVYIPQVGRLPRGFAAHHNLAWELLGLPSFNASFGTTTELLDELRRERPAITVLTSEDFELLATDIGRFEPFVRLLHDDGFDLRIIVYLRPQVDFLESLLGEAVMAGWDWRLADLLKAVREHTVWGFIQFDYCKLVDAFASVVGHRRVICRAYRTTGGKEYLLRDFVSIIAGNTSLDFRTLHQPPAMNVRASLQDVRKATIDRPTGPGVTRTRTAASRGLAHFEPLDIATIAELIAIFAESNREFRRRFGVSVGAVSLRRLARELAGTFRNSAADRERWGFVEQSR